MSLPQRSATDSIRPKEVSFRGGSQIGWVSASWPFAKLTSSADRVTVSSLGTVAFTPNQIVSFEPVSSFLGSGIRIQHNRTDYPEKVIFWCMRSRDRVLDGIARSGFSPKGVPTVRAEGFPFRWPAVILAVVVWNGLILLDRPFTTPMARSPGLGSITALVLAFIAATAVKRSPGVQERVLRPGHSVTEVASFLTLLQIIAGAMAVGFLSNWILSR